MLSKKARLQLTFQTMDAFEEAQMSFDSTNLILRTYGLDTLPEYEGPSMQDILGEATDRQLIELAEYFDLDIPVSDTPPPATATTVRGARPLLLFASHLSSQRAFLGAIRVELEYFGITLFVAHDSIPDDAAWQNEIEKGLDEADAGLVFLHPGFKESAWCPQEVGWLLGRHVPVIPLNFGVTPYGPLGKLQAGPERSSVPSAVADKILERLLHQETLREGLTASLVKAMGTSGSFNRTDRIWRHLHELDCDAGMSAELLAATKSNDQIYRANSALDGLPYTRAIVAYLRRQPEAAIIGSDIDAYEAFLNEQDAEAERRQEEMNRRMHERMAAGEAPF